MNFLSQLLRGIAFVPALVSGMEGLFASKFGSREERCSDVVFTECAGDDRCRCGAGNRSAGKVQRGYIENH